MRTSHVKLTKCLKFFDGRIAYGRNGWFHPVAVNLHRDDQFVVLQVDSTAGTPITIWFNAADARRVGEALIAITSEEEQHD